MNKNIGQYEKLVKAFNILIKENHPFYLTIKDIITASLDELRKENVVKTN